MDILIDYLTFTVKNYTYADLVELLGLQDVNWIAGKPYNGWQECNYCNGIKLLHRGREDVCADMSGTGCRFLETVNGQDFDWLGLLDELICDENVNVSRLDIACDEKEGVLTMGKMVHNTEHGKYISRSRCKRWIAGDEEAIIFGSPTSDTRLRIYNKAMERGQEGHWIRSEFQFRNEAADSFLLNLSQVQDIGRCYSGVMNNYLRYTTKNPETCGEHYDLVPTTKWWLKFLGTSEKIKNIHVGGMEYNFGSLDHYLRTQCAPSLKAYIEACGGDLTELLKMVESAQLSKKQKMLLWSLKTCSGDKQQEQEAV